MYNWLAALGFRYEPRRNNYYVDGHEKEATVQYRWKFVGRYLLDEVRMFRWIQMTIAEAKTYEEKGLVIEGSGYRYEDPNTGEPMVEYHVDTFSRRSTGWVQEGRKFPSPRMRVWE